MKLVRLLLIGLGVLVLLCALLLGVAFTSRFQTWAARKAIAGQAEFQGTIESVSAGLHRVEVKNARFERDGAVLTLPAATADLPVISAGWRRKVAIERLIAKGWVLDLTQATVAEKKPASKKTARARPADFSLLSSAYAAAVEPPVTVDFFQGIFPELQLPVDLALDGVELEGEVILPPMQGQPPLHVKVKITGGGLAAGREGSFVYDFSANSGAGVAPISAHALRGTLAARMDTPHSFTRISTKAEASVSGTEFPRGVKLNLDLAADRDAKGETYLVTLAGDQKQLAVIQAELPVAGNTPASAKLSGTWKLDLRDADLVPFVLGMTLPTFEVKGDGQLESDAAFVESHARGKLTAHAEKLANLKPELGAIGDVHLAAEFNLTRRGDVLQIQQFSADFAGAKPVASVRALQTFEFNPRTGDLTADASRDLVGITLQGLPLAWAQPFLSGLTVSGGDIQGEFVATAGGGGLTLRPKIPLTLANLSVAKDGSPLIAGVDFSVSPSIDYTPQGWQVMLSSFEAKRGNNPVLTLEAKAGQLIGQDRPIKATGKIQLNLPEVLAQSGAGGAAPLTAGDASLEFSASLGTKQEIQAKLAVTNLVAADPKLASEKLPAITTDLRADREASGKISLNLPLMVERDGRKSDLNLTGSLLPNSSGYVVDAHVTSELLIVDDVKIFGAPFGSATEAPPPTEKNPPRDHAPPWAGLSGKLTLALKKIVYSDSLEVSGVGGTLRIEAGSLKLEGLKAGVGADGELKLNGDVAFNEKVMEPYSLKAEVALNNFDSVPLFRAINPSKVPTVEGKFNLSSELNGTGANLAALAERTRGDVQLISKGGIFRGLRSDTAEMIKAAPSTLSGIVTGIGSLLGKDAAEKAAQFGSEINKRGKLVSEIATALAEIPYDQLSVSVVRGASLNIELKDFTLISPEVRLGGTGTILYQAGVPLLAQMLDLRLQLAARGKLAETMKKASLLGETQDNLGYTAFALPVQIGGSLENTDISELKRELLKAAAGSLFR
jgi:hypothetical protein